MRIIFMLGFAFGLSPLYAGILPDANTLVLSKILVQGITQVRKMQITYERITEFTRIAEQTKNEISSLLNLETSARNALLLASNIQNLKVSDVLYLARQNLQMKGSMNQYIGENTLFGKIGSQLENGNVNTQWGINFYKLFHDNSDHLSLGKPWGNDQYSGNSIPIKNIYDQMGMESYLQDQKGRMYQLMQNFATRYEEQAIELEALVKADNLFSMSTSERMNLMIQAGSLLEKSLKLRLEASQVLESKPGETIQAQNKTLELISTQKDLSKRIVFSKLYSDLY